MSSPNLARMLAEVVALEAWAQPNGNDDHTLFDLHADVTFRSDPELGDTRVRFRLRLKKATVRLIVPEGEPVRILPDTVRREAPVQRVVREETRDIATHTQLKGSLGFAGAKPQAKGAIEGERASRNTHKENIQSESTGICILHSSHAGQHEWEMTPANGEVLQSKPWRGEDTFRATVEVSSNSHLEPAVRLEVVCHAKDLLIDKIEVEDEAPENGHKIWQHLPDYIKKRGGKETDTRNKEIACRAYIRRRLFELGLHVERIDEDLKASLTLADHAIPLQDT